MNSNLTLADLRNHGHKITNSRKEIVRIFSLTEKPLTAKEIYTKLHSKKLNVNKTTVYRELQFLSDKNYLNKVHLKPSETSYESKELLHHHHLVCESCGKIDNVTNCLAEELEGKILKNKGFKITRHSLEFFGTCAKCQ